MLGVLTRLHWLVGQKGDTWSRGSYGKGKRMYMRMGCGDRSMERIEKRSSGAASWPAMAPDRYNIVEAYEAEMEEMKKRALAAAAAHKLSRYMGIVSLTCATVVVLGGFAQDLHYLDFGIISALLLLQAVRFAAASTFGRLPAARLFREHHHPDEFTHRDHQYYWAATIHAAGQIWSSSSAAATFAAAVLRLASLGSLSAYHHGNIVNCLFTFYLLAILTSLLVILAVFLQFRRGPSFSFFRNLHHHRDFTLLAFYDAVYRCALDSDLASAFDLSPLEFAFDKLRADFKRGIHPIAIKRFNERLVNYIYDVPTGIERAYHHLVTSDDMDRQLVAVNLARFWADRPRIEKQIAYFVEVGKKLRRPEKLAEAASYAVESLADKWADRSPDWLEILGRVPVGSVHVGCPRDRQHPFLMARMDTVSDKTIVDLLVELVLDPVRSSLVFQLRALESCCRSRCVVDWIRGKEYYKELIRKLVSILVGEASTGRGPRQRTKIYAASIIFHLVLFPRSTGDMGGEEGRCVEEEELRRGVEQMDLSSNESNVKYAWKKEKELLECLRKELDLPPYEWGTLKIKDPDDLNSLRN